MRLNEITKDRFKKKLKYPMELVDGITQEIERVSNDFNEQDWVQVKYDQEFGDDYVAWNIELHYQQPEEHHNAFGNTISNVYQAIVRNYQWEDVSITFHELNRKPGYLLMGIQLDV